VNVKREKKGTLCCTLCGATEVIRGNKLKRLYGENKDICLTCHYANKKGKKATNNRRKVQSELANYQTRTETQVRVSSIEEWVIFGRNNEFIGKYKDKQTMITEVRPGCKVYRLEAVPINITIEIEGFRAEVNL
jgi:hypothetical protein